MPKAPGQSISSLIISAGISFSATTIILPPPAEGVTFHAGLNAGLMQQPTSHYYHLYYGSYAEVSADDRSVLGRVYYLERPRFRSGGYEDQEASAMAMIGTKLTKSKQHGLYAMIGGGQVAGYVEDVASGEQRSYAIDGFTTLVEYSFHWQHFEVGVLHKSFTGLVTREELEAFVGWPFNFFALSMGTSL